MCNKKRSSMLFLVLLSLFINSCPQYFNSTLNDTLSNNENNIINYDEETYDEFSNSSKTTQVGGLNNEHFTPSSLPPLLSPPPLPIPPPPPLPNKYLPEEKYLVNIFLEGNYSKIFENDERKYNKSWWTDIIKEIVLFLSSISMCYEEKYLCTTNYKTEYSSERECDCDSSCGVYGECCIDKAATLPEHEKISIENRMYCKKLSLNSYGIYMIGDCLPEMKGTVEEELCHRKVEYESYDVILDIPMLSLVTNITYVNYYCAVCNNDSNSFLHLDYSISCSPKYLSGDDENLTLEEFLLEAKYFPQTLYYERTITAKKKNETEFKEGDSTVPTVDATMKSNRNARYRGRLSKLPSYQTCRVRVRQYEEAYDYARLYGSRNCIPFDERCSINPTTMREFCTKQVTACDPSWPVSADFEKCSLYSMKVFDKSKNILYKNPHCAKCNYASLRKGQFFCTDLKNGFQDYPIHTRFSVLFQIPNQSPRKCSERDEIWNPFTDRCNNIVCGTGRVLREGKCIKSKFESYKNNVTQSSSILNNCPTIAVTNFKWYDNNSVFHYNDNKFYEKGEYEQYNESIILICAENRFYFKKNFLFSYYTTVIVLSMSLLCLVFHISLYFCYSRLRTWHGRNLLSLCFSLFMAQFLFLTGTTATKNFGFCVFMAVCIHYFWLVSFFWMNILSIDIWRTFKRKFSQKSNSKKVFLLYSLFSWVSPFIIVFMSLSLDLLSKDSKYKPYYAGFKEVELCWFNNKIGHLCFFLLPVAVIVTANVIFFTITSYKIYSQSKETRFANVKFQSMKVREQNLSEEEKTLGKQEKANKNNKLRFTSYLKLGILQGLTWVFGFFASYIDLPICWYIFTVLNGLQGAAIVLSFDVKKWIFDSIWKKLSVIFMSLKFSEKSQTTTGENEEVKGFKVSSSKIVPKDSCVASSISNRKNSEKSNTIDLKESDNL